MKYIASVHVDLTLQVAIIEKRDKLSGVSKLVMKICIGDEDDAVEYEKDWSFPKYMRDMDTSTSNELLYEYLHKEAVKTEDIIISLLKSHFESVKESL